MADFANLNIGGPWYCGVDSGDANPQNIALDGSGDYCAFVFQAEEAITITKVGFRYGARTGTPPTYQAVLEGVSATDGTPDGTDVGGGSATAKTFTPPADGTWDGTWQEITLTNSYACSRGQLLALVIKYSSGTVDGSNNGSITYKLRNTLGKVFPYSIYYDGTSTIKSQDYNPFSYHSSTVDYGVPSIAVLKTEFASDDTPDEYGLAFQLSSDWVDTYTLKGIRVSIRAPSSAKTFKVVLYNDTSVLQTVTFDSDRLATNGENGRLADFIFTDSTLSTLSSDTEYIVALQPQETSARLVVNTVEVNTASYLDAFPGGQNFYLVTRTDAGAWTAVTTKRPMIDLMISDWTVSGGGGTTYIYNVIE